ncbi:MULTISPECIES: helix-turn-helix transcriptional regulator [Microbacterium]|jgi:HTH-type transcriptional regulator/antitoxin HipB|uniref:helix-turn-helix transcriptional regulator n=1 Tax=Microbacterium TaxID=33882 RepID=UPI000C4BB037|nr:MULTISPECIES: helix-turn-helix transcriptional regulator [Microbacterium]MAB19549.1 transcriptional regulator [Microbacterium sp.]MAM53309.1 transcriptional regulator [Microbacterium sp.]HAS31449.1 transcriptional regulator [Microbacterium sp.]|tara:strand:+ start:336 stop:548 length:213 start_codon:yes stop_codon:yes gene_type:complete
MLVVTPADLGNIVRDRRRDRGMSQGALAEAVGMSRQWVVRFENGNAATATVDHLLRLAEALDLDVEVAAP